MRHRGRLESLNAGGMAALSFGVWVGILGQNPRVSDPLSEIPSD